MENQDRRLILGVQSREAIALILAIVFLIAFTYLIAAFIMQVLPSLFVAADRSAKVDCREID